jgi:hypothetical protein
MRTYANFSPGQAKPAEMTACCSATKGFVSADFSRIHYEAIALAQVVSGDLRPTVEDNV